MTISHYYKCDFCGEKRYISTIDEAQSVKSCPYCENEYAPFNLIEEISPDLIITSTNESSDKETNEDYKYYGAFWSVKNKTYDKSNYNRTLEDIAKQQTSINEKSNINNNLSKTKGKIIVITSVWIIMMIIFYINSMYSYDIGSVFVFLFGFAFLVIIGY